MADNPLITSKQVRELAGHFWTVPEMASFFEVSEEYLEEHFGEVIERARGRAKGEIRELVWKAAQRGQRSAIAHLAKHQLGEHDTIQHTVAALTDEQLAAIVQKRIEAKEKKQQKLIVKSINSDPGEKD